MTHALDRLAVAIDARKTADPDSSWTAKLLAKGPEKCAEKFGEEAIEAIIACAKNDRENLTYEAADVLYGVTMERQGVSRVLKLDLRQAEELLGSRPA